MKKIATFTASMALAMYAFTPLALASSLELTVTGNGADSQNTTNVSSDNSTVVSQTNSANITNNVSANSSSGDNNASKNTGGGVSVDTGDSKTLVSVSNTANSNVADVNNCACDADALVKISGNGADTKNNANLELNNNTTVAQTNNGSVLNKVHADSSTGDNKADKNTGGTVEVSTGDALTHVDLTTNANSNLAKVGGNGAGGSDVSLWISGNGADSKNSIALALDHNVLLQQKNNASIDNYVDANATTGDNKVHESTGGASSITTGDAWSGVAVDNAANFNWANIDCDCITNVAATVAENGADTYNKIKASLTNDNNIFQDNSCGYQMPSVWSFDWMWNNHGCGIDNSLHANADTGSNYLNESTGSVNTDPEVTTGDSESLVGVDNTGNSNVYGSLPDDSVNQSGVNINISFNLQDLLNALMH